jgi:hypothetical protein
MTKQSPQSLVCQHSTKHHNPQHRLQTKNIIFILRDSMWRIDKNLIKLTKTICKIPNNTTNILVDLNDDNYVSTTSILLDYITYISKQLIQSLNDQVQLRKTYQGLTKHIVIKYGRSLNLPKLTHQACGRSPTAMTLFLLEKQFEIHIDTIKPSFTIRTTPLWYTMAYQPTICTITPEEKLTQPKNIIPIMYNEPETTPKPWPWHH